MPDGLVKVSTQVIVEQKRIRIQYDVGFNPRTLDQLVKEFSPETRRDSRYAGKVSAFRKTFKAKILESLTVKVNNRFVKADQVLVEPDEIAKHVQARFKLSFDVPVTRETRIQVADVSFQNQARTCHAGFKAAGSIAVKTSSTRAIPIRSKPIEKKANQKDPFVITGTVVNLGAACPPVSR